MALWEGPEGALGGGRISLGLRLQEGRASALMESEPAKDFVCSLSSAMMGASFSESNIASSSVSVPVSLETPVHEKVVSKRPATFAELLSR